jgi:hypothetical protein
MLSTPGRAPDPLEPAFPPRRAHGPCRPGGWDECVAVDPRMHSFHTGVHRVCTAGDGFCTGPAPRRTPIGISAGRGPIRAAQRAVRRSVDHRGRPTRRDPDVRRGATATLTASSTARQRLGDPDRRVGPRSVRRAATASCVGGWTMGGRDPPGHRRLPVLGYAGRSLWTVPSAAAWSGFCPGGCGGGDADRSVQLPGAPEGGYRAAHRSPRVCPPTGGCTPPSSCRRSTS